MKNPKVVWCVKGGIKFWKRIEVCDAKCDKKCNNYYQAVDKMLEQMKPKEGV